MTRTVLAIVAGAALVAGCIGDINPEPRAPSPTREVENWRTAPREVPTPAETR